MTTHAFIIAVACYGGLALLGLLLQLKDGARLSWASIFAGSLSLGMGLWAVVLLAQRQ